MTAAPDLRQSTIDGEGRSLFAAIAQIRELLEQRVSGKEVAPAAAPPPDTADQPQPNQALQTLRRQFDLSSFETDILALCAGAELDPAISLLCGAMQGDDHRRCATFRIALEVLPDAHWSALLPEAPLRRWKLLDLGAGEMLTTSPLRIEEPVLHFLMGAPVLDERLRTCVDVVEPPTMLPGSYRPHAERLVGLWSKPEGRRAVAQLQGSAADGKRTLAAAACGALGLRMYTLRVGALPASPAEREGLAQLWDRDAVMTGSALLLLAEDASPAQWEAASVMADRTQSPLLVAGSGALSCASANWSHLTSSDPGPTSRVLCGNRSWASTPTS